MRVLVEAGHGQDYRQQGDYDPGWISDRRVAEVTICWQYALRLIQALRTSGHSALGLKSGSVVHRLKTAFKQHRELIVSLHLGLDPTGQKGGKVIYATEGSKEIAQGLAEALEFTVERREEAGLLLFNPSVEIELGNIACWENMKRLGCEAAAQGLCSRIADALTRLGL